MSITYRDLVMEFCYTTGTGPLTLAGTTNGFRTALTAWGAGDHESHWVIRHPANGQWEVFRGTVNGTGLTRDEVLASSNGGLLVDFSPGRKEVRCTLPASVFEPVLLPTADTTEIVRDPVDSTKRMRIDVGAVATATTRVVTVPNQDVDLTPNTGTFPASTAALTSVGGLTPAADRLPYYTGASAAALTPITSYARTLLDDSDAATARATLGVTIGTHVQAYDATLAALAAYNTNGIIVQTAADTFAGRTIAAGTGVSVTNGDGVAGNPLIAIGQAVAPSSTVQFEQIGVGTPPVGSNGITLANTALTGVVQYGFASSPVLSSSAVNGGGSFLAQPSLAAASFTAPILSGFRVNNPAAFSGGAAATLLMGIYVADLTRGTSNFAFYSGVSDGSGKWGWYGNGTAKNLFNGSCIHGSSAAPTLAADQAAIHGIDAAAGNRCIGWKTENGQTGKLYTVNSGSAYTPTNVTTDRSFDANSTTLDEIADVLGTLIADLKLTGLLA
jgi:hypothetical protein